MALLDRLKQAWNVFKNRDPTYGGWNLGNSYSYRPDRTRYSRGNERSIVTSVYNRIAMDASAIRMLHVKLDENNRFLEEVHSGLDICLTLEANIDQTGRAFMQDVVASLLDEGCVAVVPVWTESSPLYEWLLYSVNQEHTSQDDWRPDQTPALYRRIADPSEEWPPWSPVITALDVWDLGAKCSHNGKHWVSNIPNNSYEPGVYGWDEVG